VGVFLVGPRNRLSRAFVEPGFDDVAERFTQKELSKTSLSGTLACPCRARFWARAA
jgi:hypothetical protein